MTETINICYPYVGKVPVPGSDTMTCHFCGKVFNSDKSGKAVNKLHGHLCSCKKRILIRYCTFGNIVAILTMFPRKRTIRAINTFLQENAQSPEMVAGVLLFLQNREDIRNFDLIEIKNSPEFSKVKPGVHALTFLRRHMSKVDEESFGKLANTAFENRLQGV